ncbi:MAG: PIN domain-containing protein [Halobacteriales archaeon]|nr:PIN domain-containing protein [Halobacteriales archaeon]
MRILPDVNALAIQLVDDHPGYPYVTEQLSPALAGDETMLLFGYLPLRVQWVLEDLGFSTVDARNAITSLLRRPMESVDVSTETVLDAYELSVEKNHDVYDCFYLAVAREADATHLLTTDRDFATLCEDEPFEYLNPVPEDVLTRFDTAGE